MRASRMERREVQDTAQQRAETDAPNPLHVYGETKAAAEEIVLKNPRHLVVRTSLNAGVSRSGDRSFNERLRLARERATAIGAKLDIRASAGKGTTLRLTLPVSPA